LKKGGSFCKIDSTRLLLKPNVPPEWEQYARTALAGYCAHICALDEQLGRIWKTLRKEGIEEETIFVYTSDHGDMLGSHGQENKQRPWDESVLVPFLLRYPSALGNESRIVDIPICTLDIMPTLLDLCGIDIPDTVQGVSFAPYLLGRNVPPVDAALIECIHPFGQFIHEDGGKEYRGIRTEQYTYVRDLQGPWLLYDNVKDPCQLDNLIGTPEGDALLPELDAKLQSLLDRHGDEFLHGDDYINLWGYPVDENGTVPYTGYDPDGE
jgi:arylsulfatase A-like enzyme